MKKLLILLFFAFLSISSYCQKQYYVKIFVNAYETGTFLPGEENVSITIQVTRDQYFLLYKGEVLHDGTFGVEEGRARLFVTIVNKWIYDPTAKPVYKNPPNRLNINLLGIKEYNGPYRHEKK